MTRLSLNSTQSFGDEFTENAIENCKRKRITGGDEKKKFPNINEFIRV